MSKGLLALVAERTKLFLECMPKSLRKNKGQFFTSLETARFMAAMFDLSLVPDCIRILDPGAGSGMLSAALVERLNEFGFVKSIHLTCYETDKDIKALLKENLDLIKANSSIPLEYELLSEDYILSQQSDFREDMLASNNPPKYDLIIANPPYLRLLRNDASALAMPGIVHGAPNLYFLFASMSLFNLRQGGEMVYIIPRSWTSGLYFLEFRKYLLSQGRAMHIHLFASRNKVFREEEVLQETMIIKIRKTFDTPENVLVTTSQSSVDFKEMTSLNVPYASVVAGKDTYVFLPTSKDEMEVIRKIHSYSSTLPDEGFRMRTGIVVNFRQWNELRKQPGEHIVPLFYSQHIRNGRVNHTPSGKDYDWIVDAKPGLIQRNKNYVFCKRFTAKEEARRLQCGIYIAEDFPDYDFIGTQNKINYVDLTDGTNMDLPSAYGIFALLNSTLFDKYYRILNGSTQVNSTEVNSIPVPPVDIIRKIGNRMLETGELTTQACDRILSEVAYG